MNALDDVRKVSRLEPLQGGTKEEDLYAQG